MPSFVWRVRTIRPFQKARLADTRAARRVALQGSWSHPGEGPRDPLLPRSAGVSQAGGDLTRQFSVMLDAGLPLVQCLEILGEQEEDKHFRRDHPDAD